jgi:uncharacterized OB-fold protein
MNKQCSKCGREVPKDRDCPTCEAGPWWPMVTSTMALVVAAFLWSTLVKCPAPKEAVVVIRGDKCTVEWVPKP